MANDSRWQEVKNKRREPSAEAEAGVEKDLALGQLTYDLRTEAELSHRALAERMGTTQSVISRPEEGGGARNRIDALARVATALDRHLILSFPRRSPPSSRTPSSSPRSRLSFAPHQPGTRAVSPLGSRLRHVTPQPERGGSGSSVGLAEGQLPSVVVSSDDPYVRLPDHIELTLAEAGELLEVLDVAVSSARTGRERAVAREAALMITDKLWPGLGDLLDGDEGE